MPFQTMARARTTHIDTMSEKINFPIFTLTGAAFVEAAHAAVAFLRIYIVPIIGYALALVVARVAWFEHVSNQKPLPVWAEVALWAPFGAVVAIATFRYFHRIEIPKWRHDPTVPTCFAAAIAALMGANLTYRYSPYLELTLAHALWNFLFGSNWALIGPDEQRLAGWLYFAIQVCGLVFSALISMFCMGIVWVIATENRLDTLRLRQLVSVFPISLLVYFFLFEVIVDQVAVIYSMLLGWLGIPMPSEPSSQFWRERVVPEFLRQIPALLPSYILDLVWLSASAVVYRWLDAQCVRSNSE